MNHNNPQSSSDGKHDDDSALSDFLASLMDTLPLIRLVAVATQKFVAEVASDALQHCKAGPTPIVKDKRDKQQKDKRLILTMDDLSKSLREYGVNVKHQEYFADGPSTGIDPASRDE
ncbi:hypothetical protein PTKIN_Ptkin19aG0131800 [Pterospermum kingtungense]